MLYKIVKENQFKTLMQKHIEEIILYCFEKEQNFGILCRIEHTTFDPVLPDEIHKDFRDVTLFFLAGYTFETARIEDNMLIFEAGFGATNVGSLVSIPLLGIMQIIIDETPIFINVALYEEEDNSTQDKPQPNSSGIENSMSALLSNPENQKFKK
jgi:hypothetical protein